jgi:hypothetical protein
MTLFSCSCLLASLKLDTFVPLLILNALRMAKIKLGAIVVAMSGKLGGHVFATNKGGAYMRTKTTPNNPQTSFQTVVRNIFATLSSAWSGLTAGQRLSWNTAVEAYKRTDIFGDLKVPSGKALHQRLNQNLVLKLQAALTNAPLPAPVLTAQLLSIVFDTVSVCDLTFDDTPVSGDVLVYATPPVSLGTSFVKNKLRYIATTAAITVDVLGVYADYDTRLGAPVVGEKIFFGIRFMNANGEVSPIQIKEVIVTVP